MLPESPTSPQQATPQNLAQSSESIFQHGPHDHDPPIILPSADRADTGTLEAAHRSDDAVNAGHAGSSAFSMHPNQAMKSSKPASLPARNRVDEYEKASAQLAGKSVGPTFEVIKKHRSPSDKRSPIQELPNEILTHALANLAPDDMASVSLVSKRFHDLVTDPYAWRSAFARFFPGINSTDSFFNSADEDDRQHVLRSDRRAFTRLTTLATWRSEYIMRARLLRSLSRGKPIQAAPTPASHRSGQGSNIAAVVMYNSQLFTTINHIHANFGPSSMGLNKKLPRFIHGADDVGMATSSDPSTAKVDPWGLSDPQVFLQFAERFPGDAQFGLGPGVLVGVPNSMDVSQPYGMVIGEGSPGGMTYFRSTEEMRGRYLLLSCAISIPEIGVPRIPPSAEAITTVWIAKSASIPSISEGLMGILSGSSLGVITAYSLGSAVGGNHRDQRFTRGELTARWVLSPGVPIIAIALDDDYSLKRHAQNRIWAVALNALGEIFYLTKFPRRPPLERGARLDDELLERTAWLTGRSVYWQAVESSRRTAKIDPYAAASVDGSYSPRSSWNGMCLSQSQISAETREIEEFAARKPIDFRKLCTGWDMRRKLEVDFAGDDGQNAGEHVIIFECGLDEESVSEVKRFTRTRFHERSAAFSGSTPPMTSSSSVPSSPPSIFGTQPSPVLAPLAHVPYERLQDSLPYDELGGSLTPRPMGEEWRSSRFSLGGLKHVQITATAIDCSTFATLTVSEDPLLSLPNLSASSSPSRTPILEGNTLTNSSDVPGQRARLFAAGTRLGTVLVWDARAPVSQSVDLVNWVSPVRVIHTDSPQIACLALSSLYIVHGGNDGLVQAWDLLASEAAPVRTLNSRFSSRARRRLVQAQASPQGVGINLFAAGAICLDPDPTVLRGIVSLGTHLRYWSYSSSTADQYKSSKRKLRRSERGSNSGGERFSGAIRSNFKDLIASERYELDWEKEQRRRESLRFAGRFGTDLLDGSEEEMLAYAAMLSHEALERENQRRTSDTSATPSTAASSTEPNLLETPSSRLSTPKTDDELDADIAEAIRQSLATSPGTSYDIPIRQAKPRNHRKGSSAKASPRVSPFLAGSSKTQEMNDLDFALQLSLAEEQSNATATQTDAFPSLPPSSGSNGKGKRKE